jgi:hypothetical protein
VSTSTTKLGLVKPAAGEKYSRSTYNNNLDIIDADSRAFDKMLHFEAYVLSQQTPTPASTWWGPSTPITAARQSDASFNDAEFTEAVPSATGTDGIKLTKEGIYTVTWGIGNASASSLPLWHIVCGDGSSPQNANNTVLGRSPTFSIPSGDWYYMYAENFYVGPAGKNIFFKYSAGTANVPITHRIRITKLA